MCLLLLGSVANAAENKTKLVVGITVSNFYPEWLDVYQRELTSGGLRRIMQGSVKLKAGLRLSVFAIGYRPGYDLYGLAAFGAWHGVARLVRPFGGDAGGECGFRAIYGDRRG